MTTQEILADLEHDRRNQVNYRFFAWHTSTLSQAQIAELDRIRQAYESIEPPEEYWSYIRSDYWKTFSRQFRQGKQCMVCGSRYSLHAHHVHYRSLNAESEESVVVLCSRCHALVHPFSKLAYGIARTHHRRRRFEEFYSIFPNARISDGTLAKMSPEALKVFIVASAHLYYEQFPTDTVIARSSGVTHHDKIRDAKEEIVRLGLIDPSDIGLC